MGVKETKEFGFVHYGPFSILFIASLQNDRDVAISRQLQQHGLAEEHSLQLMQAG